MTLKWPYMSFLAIFKFDLEITVNNLRNDETLRVTLGWSWVTLTLGGDLNYDCAFPTHPNLSPLLKLRSFSVYAA